MPGNKGKEKGRRGARSIADEKVCKNGRERIRACLVFVVSVLIVPRSDRSIALFRFYMRPLVVWAVVLYYLLLDLRSTKWAGQGEKRGQAMAWLLTLSSPHCERPSNGKREQNWKWAWRAKRTKRIRLALCIRERELGQL